MSLDAQQLFALLPAVYRTRDELAGGPLQSLFAVMAAQAAIVEDNIQQLYDDQFIETCGPWVIPYIGDLIGYNSRYEVAAASSDSRAEVANTIGYRRRKGTLIALEQLACDVSGRAAVVVEEFQRLITTESMRHVEPGRQGTVDVRTLHAPYRPDSPFDIQNHTIDVRRVAPRVRAIATPDTAPLDIALHGPGRFNIPDVAIHLWRWQSWPVVDAPAFVLGGGRYMFSPLGADIPLFSQRTTAQSFSALADRSTTPAPIARGELRDFYGPDASILLSEDGVPVPEDRICCANLSDRPDGSWCTVPAGKIAIDPELGRIKYAADVAQPQSLELSYSYGFPAPIGGGSYDRSGALAQLEPVSADLFAIVGSADYPTLEAAVTEWNGKAPGATWIIVVPGFDSLTVDLTGAAAVKLPVGSNLSIVSGVPDPAGGVIWSGSHVTLTGDIEVIGVAASAPPAAGTAAPVAGQLLINGLCIAGQLLVSGAASTIQLADSTLVPGLGLLPEGEPIFPGEPSVSVTATGATLVLNRVISGAIAADPSGTTRVCASIVDATSPSSVAYAASDLASTGGDLHVEDSTIVGKVSTRTITLASNTIFHAQLALGDPWPAPVIASRRQSGCVRFCVLPYASITPRRYNCLPPDAASEPSLGPEFVCLRYGNPAYALLSGDCPMAIWNGADNGSQLGAYLQIQETEAVSNVQLRAPEYLPALLESGIFIHPAHATPTPRPPAGPYDYGQQAGADTELPGIGAGLI